MAKFTEYAKDRILNYYFVSGNSFTQNPSSGTPNTYATLLTGSDPGNAGSLAGEIANLSRVSIPWAAAADADGELATTSDVTFTTTSVTGSHTVNYVGIVEDTAGSTPKLLAYGALSTPITVDSTASVKIATGNLKVGYIENSQSSPNDAARAISDDVAKDSIDATFKYDTPSIANPATATTLDLALFQTDTHPLSTSDEFSGAGSLNYTRQSVQFSAAAAGTSGDRRKVTNSATVTFQNIGVSGTTNATLKRWAVFNGTQLLAVNVFNAINIQDGSDITFAAGDIVIEIE